MKAGILSPEKILSGSLSLLFLFIFSGSYQPAQAQNQVPKKEGSLTIQQDPRLDSLLLLNKKINEEKQTMDGFRVQLYFGTDRKKATDMKSLFLQKHSEIPAYVIYQQPNFKVRVGDYLTRLEAYKLFMDLSPEYPSAFVVKDDIALPPVE